MFDEHFISHFNAYMPMVWKFDKWKSCQLMAFQVFKKLSKITKKSFYCPTFVVKFTMKWRWWSPKSDTDLI